MSLCAHGNARFRLHTPGQRPGGPKAISYQYAVRHADVWRVFGAEEKAKGRVRTIGAEHLASRPDARTLSGGERQLVALARALAADRPVLLLDEPTSGLDPDAQALVLRAIEHLCGKRSIVIVTHRPEPLAIADSVIDPGDRASGAMKATG